MWNINEEKELGELMLLPSEIWEEDFGYKDFLEEIEGASQRTRESAMSHWKDEF